MSRVAAVLVALAVAVHVAVPVLAVAAPVPVLLAFAGVLSGLALMIAEVVARNGGGVAPVTYWR